MTQQAYTESFRIRNYENELATIFPIGMGEFFTVLWDNDAPDTIVYTKQQVDSAFEQVRWELVVEELEEDLPRTFKFKTPEDSSTIYTYTSNNSLGLFPKVTWEDGFKFYTEKDARDNILLGKWVVLPTKDVVVSTNIPNDKTMISLPEGYLGRTGREYLFQVKDYGTTYSVRKTEAGDFTLDTEDGISTGQCWPDNSDKNNWINSTQRYYRNQKEFKEDIAGEFEILLNAFPILYVHKDFLEDLRLLIRGVDDNISEFSRGGFSANIWKDSYVVKNIVKGDWLVKSVGHKSYEVYSTGSDQPYTCHTDGQVVAVMEVLITLYEAVKKDEGRFFTLNVEGIV